MTGQPVPTVASPTQFAIVQGDMICGLITTNVDMTQVAPSWTLVTNVPDGVLLAYYQGAMSANFEAACAAWISAGFTSSALGAAYGYPADDNSQKNLISAAIASVGAGAGWSRAFWCADATGAWAMRPHTAAQIQQVNADFNNFVAAAQERLAGLKAALAAAATSAEALALAW